MRTPIATPFDQLHWSAQDIADAVPLRLHEIDLFDAATLRDARSSANASREPHLRHAYLPNDALPARFGIR